MEIVTILVVLVDQFYLDAPAHKTLGFWKIYLLS